MRDKMRLRIKNVLNRLRKSSSGNATIMVAVGMPMLIGSSGLAVDVAQWYMWKRELQYAADQAALAGAWARSSNNTSVQSTYITRANQEYNANVSAVSAFDATPSVSLANYNGGTNNSVLVYVSATKRLPFSSMLTRRSATITATAQASFRASTTFSSCMLAVNPSANQAFKLGGSVTGGSTCGAGSLSDHPTASMKEVGNTSIPLGQLIATGGIDPGFANNGTINQFQSGLYDPYAALTPPSSAGAPARSYSCPTAQAASTTTTATVLIQNVVTYIYVGGNNSNQALSNAAAGTTVAYSPVTAGSTTTVSNTNNVTVPNGTMAGVVNGTPTFTYVRQVRSSPTRVHEVMQTVRRTTYSNINVVTTPAVSGTATLQPGAYTSISIGCQTQFQPGIYFISGSLDFGQNQTVTGSDVMFVMTSASGNIKINSNSVVDLRGITAATLTSSYGYTSAEATKLAGMLFWDKDSTGAFDMNGNASVKIDGLMYMPKRDATFNGNVSAATGGCMMVASNTLTIIGNFNITNFCAPTGSSAMAIGGGTATVKLVR